MRSVIIISLISLFFAGCSQKNKIPAGILPQQKMRLIIWDLLRADEYINSFMANNNKVDLKTERFVLYEQVFKLHAVDQKKFQKSLSFYQTRPDLFKVIADSLRGDERRVLDEQSQMRQSIIDTAARGVSVKPATSN
jgi:hypothetical protein